MNRIFASKLYKASKRKSSINAAMSNPFNGELLVQLKEYLDDEYIDLMDKEELEEVPDDGEQIDSEGESSDAEDTPSDDIEIDDSLTPSFDEDFNPADNLVTIEDDEADESSESSESDDVATSSILPDKEPVVASEKDLDIQVIKGTLNGRSDTCGVNRILIKDDELKIYYNDDVNLNNVMGPAIELLNEVGETCLEFNRLARSDNAIVFQIVNQTKMA